MTYFKVLRWRGGEGGDTMLHAFLISNSFLKSNVNYNSTFINTNGRTTIDNAANLSENLRNIITSVSFVDNKQLQKDLELLQKQGNWLIKSHYFGNDFNAITILPTEQTEPFFFSARFSKIPLRNLASTEEKIKVLIKDKQEFMEFEKNKILEEIKKANLKEQDVIFIDDILARNFSKLENKLQLKINDQGKSFINKWFLKQKELFPKELAAFS